MRAITTTTDAALVDEVSKVFKLACLEKDWEVAEFLLQALEAIAGRDGDAELLESSYGELLPLPSRGCH